MCVSLVFVFTNKNHSVFVCRGVWWGRWQGPGVVWKAKSEIVSAYVGVLLAVSLCMCMCVQARSPPCKSESDSSSSGLANSYQHPFCGGCCSLVACIHAQTLAQHRYAQTNTRTDVGHRYKCVRHCFYCVSLLRVFFFVYFDFPPAASKCTVIVAGELWRKAL